MFSREKNLVLFGLTLAVVMAGCEKAPEPPRAEQPPPAEAVLPPATATVEVRPEPAANLSPPTQDEVRGAVARVYKDAVVVDTSRFAVGDFNGDGSQDLAVAVTPATTMLGEINSEVANWILEDPQKIVLPDPKKTTQRLAPVPAPTRVAQSDVLLVVLHGHGPSGWRNPESRQTYLLKNAVGAGIRSQKMTTLQKANTGKTALPKLLGDVISETLGAEPGFLYYNGSKYVWYPRSRGGRISRLQVRRTARLASTDSRERPSALKTEQVIRGQARAAGGRTVYSSVD